MMTASQLEPRLHFTPPVLTRPDFGKTSDEDYMTVAKTNGQLKKIFIFSVLSHISLQNWRARHVSPGGQESAKRENGGTRVCQKVCITSVNTLPCRIKTTSVAEGKKETMVSRITHTLKKKPDGGFTTDYFVETKYSHARNQWIIFVLTSCFADKGNNPSCCHLRFAPLFSSMYIVSHLIDWGILFYMEYNFL